MKSHSHTNTVDDSNDTYLETRKIVIYDTKIFYILRLQWLMTLSNI